MYHNVHLAGSPSPLRLVRQIEKEMVLNADTYSNCGATTCIVIRSCSLHRGLQLELLQSMACSYFMHQQMQS